jgi:uncharacterized Zn finger protein (UPF0148 family)
MQGWTQFVGEVFCPWCQGRLLELVMVAYPDVPATKAEVREPWSEADPRQKCLS